MVYDMTRDMTLTTAVLKLVHATWNLELGTLVLTSINSSTYIPGTRQVKANESPFYTYPCSSFGGTSFGIP